MIKHTSKIAYDYCEKNGITQKRMQEVILCLKKNGAMNQTMVHKKIVEETGEPCEKYSHSPGFAVLERMGVIEQDSVQPCPYTGRNTIYWKFTERRPMCSAKRAREELKTENGSLKERVKKLETDNLKLKQAMHRLASIVNTNQMELGF